MCRIILGLSSLLLIAADRPVRRACPPVFDKAARSLFMENAFESLKGERPSFVHNEAEKPKEEEVEISGGGDFDRGDMMNRLEAAESSVAAALANENSFRAASHKIGAASEVIMMIGKTLFSNDPDYCVEDAYLKRSEDMTNAARQLKARTLKGDYEGAVQAFSSVKKNCNDCHSEFRL